MKFFRCFLSLFFLWFSLNAYSANRIDGVRVWPAPESTRVVFDANTKIDYSYFSLSNPQRLVIDFKQSQNAMTLKGIANNDKRILKIRTSTPKNKTTTRVVLELAEKYNVVVFPLAPAGQYGHRLVVDLKENAATAKKTKQPNKVINAQVIKKRDVIIGIDAGHGGEDPGSIGPKGTYEKKVTLIIAKKLAQLINAEKGMSAVMIRTGDYYVGLDRRTELARKKRVDFLVSIHADAFRTPQPNGASVWVVSNRRAESELSRWLDNRQRNSELLGGGGGVIKTTDDDNLALTLADMSREHSLDVSIGVSKKVLAELKKITKLHKKQTQYKSLAVLKASDIPSILVETGFISNHQEERNLTSSKHQAKLAKALHTGIKQYFVEHPLSGSYFASIESSTHVVKSGESLSVLAKRYNVTVKQLKSANKLTSNVVRIGQKLTIPRA